MSANQGDSEGIKLFHFGRKLPGTEFSTEDAPVHFGSMYAAVDRGLQLAFDVSAGAGRGHDNALWNEGVYKELRSGLAQRLHARNQAGSFLDRHVEELTDATLGAGRWTTALVEGTLCEVNAKPERVVTLQSDWDDDTSKLAELLRNKGISDLRSESSWAEIKTALKERGISAIRYRNAFEDSGEYSYAVVDGGVLDEVNSVQLQCMWVDIQELALEGDPEIEGRSGYTENFRATYRRKALLEDSHSALMDRRHGISFVVDRDSFGPGVMRSFEEKARPRSQRNVWKSLNDQLEPLMRAFSVSAIADTRPSKNELREWAPTDGILYRIGMRNS